MNPNLTPGPARLAVAGLAGVVATGALAALAPEPAAAADPVTVQVVATNDFHGRLVNESSQVAGAAVLSGAVKELRAENPHTAFVAAGDLIGASTFESFIADDEPTIAALNEAGLDVSAVGNHELDRGFTDLKQRVEGLADWEYVAANLRRKVDDTHPFAPSWKQDFGGVTVGFVGAVTEDLPALVSPAGISNLDVTGIVEEVNAAAADLKDGGADVVVMLVHEGAPSTTCATMDDPGTTWGDIVTGASADVDAIVSGHTHLAYDCSFEVGAWVAEGRPVTERPVVSAGQYGMNLNRLTFTVDPDSGQVQSTTQEILPLEGPDPDGSGPQLPPSLYPADPAVAALVADAVTKADELGAQELGTLSGGALERARWSEPDNGDPDDEPQTVENRGGESNLGNLVAEVHRWATAPDAFGGAQIAFMNPGGLRADLVGPAVTYRQAANVQPFGNTLVNMRLTGAQVKKVLEQQWQRDAEGNVPSRPFLRLGTSAGFEYSYDPSLPEGSRITGMWLDGEPIDKAASYSVTANSFLAAGGDNFRAFTEGAAKKDTGQIDLQAMVAYLDEFGDPGQGGLPVDDRQHSVGATVADGEIGLSSLSMTGPAAETDQEVEVFDGDTPLGSFPVTTQLSDAPFDEAGTATVPLDALPTDGKIHTLRVVGPDTGTDVLVPVRAAPKSTAKLRLVVRPDLVRKNRTHPRLVAKVTTDGAPATGKVRFAVRGTTYRRLLEDGRAKIRLKPFAKIGKKPVTVTYLGNPTTLAAVTTGSIRVRR